MSKFQWGDPQDLALAHTTAQSSEKIDTGGLCVCVCVCVYIILTSGIYIKIVCLPESRQSRVI